MFLVIFLGGKIATETQKQNVWEGNTLSKRSRFIESNRLYLVLKRYCLVQSTKIPLKLARFAKAFTARTIKMSISGIKLLKTLTSTICLRYTRLYMALIVLFSPKIPQRSLSLRIFKKFRQKNPAGQEYFPPSFRRLARKYTKYLYPFPFGSVI